MNDIQLARVLGTTAVVFGAVRAVAAHRISRDLGIGSPALVRSLGLQKVAIGLAVLAAPDNPGPMWARVTADMMELATLGRAMASGGRHRDRAAAAAVVLLGGAVLDILCATALERRRSKAIDAGRRTGVGAPPSLAGV